jgi:hypothetical protein
MCSLKTSGGNRTSVDLICVIDVSGSMRRIKNIISQGHNEIFSGNVNSFR